MGQAHTVRTASHTLLDIEVLTPVFFHPHFILPKGLSEFDITATLTADLGMPESSGEPAGDVLTMARVVKKCTAPSVLRGSR
jgi:hypothetical protein